MRQIEIQDAAQIAQLIKKKYDKTIKVSAVFDELFLLEHNTFKDEALSNIIKSLLKIQLCKQQKEVLEQQDN